MLWPSLVAALSITIISPCFSFKPNGSWTRLPLYTLNRQGKVDWRTAPMRSTTTEEDSSTSDNVIDALNGKSEDIELAKSRLIQLCRSSTKIMADIRDAMFELEQQATEPDDRLISGEWELLYTSTDVTRSSPFFWAFRKAFPDSTSDAIFGITDAIPAPLKEVGPAFQEIDITSGPNCRGRLVSRVQVATLGGAATSIMTTRASILGALDGDARRLRLKIETTKPEQSTILDKLLGPLSATLQEQLPPFPSGEALERVVPGSSEVILLTTFCDAALRISKNDDRPDDEFFIWQRKSFASYDVL